MPHKVPRKSSHKASSHNELNLDAVSGYLIGVWCIDGAARMTQLIKGWDTGCEMVGSGSTEASSPRRLDSSVEVDHRGYHGIDSRRGWAHDGDCPAQDFGFT
ncbi:predicted protein [Verticillium alfalfae VaMs.102]|uniref:Predicted protein n=1 Tax=Verticillium alfalfae (strain VaMs.102 / ATCC MYA-4576 / FGSC 10136) TaxID=526221 RepID=C9SW60_VERA1|nr:predicted protein [Verticillium alfalfae VaMs.102]EEY23025.1 predicted protein [Verticillium alfalfae VaMs.102]